MIVPGVTSFAYDYSAATFLTTVDGAAHVLTAGNTNLVFLRNDNHILDITSVTDTAGNVYSFVALTSVADSTDSMYLYACVNCLGHASNVVTAVSSTSFFQAWGILTVQYSGTISTSVAALIDQIITATGVDFNTITSDAYGPTDTPGEMVVVAAQVSDTAHIWTPQGSLGNRVTDDQGVVSIADYLVPGIKAGGSTETMNLNATGKLALFGVTLRPAIVSSSTPIFLYPGL